jgi:hypothetical protein
MPPAFAQADLWVLTLALERMTAMSFTRIGKIIAHLAFWFGLLSIAMALLFLFAPEFRTTDGQLYSGNPGNKLDVGFKYIVIGVALGVLCEISSKKDKRDAPA